MACLSSSVVDGLGDALIGFGKLIEILLQTVRAVIGFIIQRTSSPTRSAPQMPGSSPTMWGMASFTRAQEPRLPADYAQSIEQIDPRLIARTLDEGASTDRIDLLDVLYSLMEQAIYPDKTELNDDEHTEVARTLEDGAYSVTRLRHDSPLYRALIQRFNGNGQALTDAFAPSIIDELTADLYALMTPDVLEQRIAGLFVSQS